MSVKIPPSDHPKIWARYKKGDISQWDLAREYNVTQGAMSRIIRADPDYKPAGKGGGRSREIFMAREDSGKPSQWAKPLQRAKQQADIVNEGLRKAVLLAREDGLTLRQIAEESGLSRAQVNWIVKHSPSTNGQRVC